MLPQHFQQHDRYFENLIHHRCRAIRPYGYGFYRVAIDRELLQIGKLAIAECQGVFPDGTPFNMPDEDPLPLPLEIPSDPRLWLVFGWPKVKLRIAIAVLTDPLSFKSVT